MQVMEMTWKIFKLKGKLGSARQKIFNLFGLFHGIRSVSLTAPVSYETTNPFTYAHTQNYLLESEIKKAEALMYWQRLNHPK